MTLHSLLKGSGLSALAAALAFTALPSSASAQRNERPNQHRVDDERTQGHAEARRENRREDRGANQANRNQQAQVRAAARQRAAQAQAQARSRQVAQGQQRGEERRGRDWNRSDRRSEAGQQRSGREWNRGDRGVAQQRAEIDRRLRERGVTRGDRNPTYTDPNRNPTYRDRRDGERWRDRNRDDRRGDYRNDRRGDYRDRNDTQHRRWDRRWRDHNRYNWHRYRAHNRNVFQIGRYYSPYRDYRYNRLSIGIRLGSGFYNDRYWINDPWQYRLPEVYGPYRWVRYYDDVLLVNTYSGEVVDVIYDFFW